MIQKSKIHSNIVIEFSAQWKSYISKIPIIVADWTLESSIGVNSENIALIVAAAADKVNWKKLQF